MAELYEGQVEKVAAELTTRELIQQADRELLETTTDPEQRQIILRRIAGREGDLANRRRFLAKLRGENEDGVKAKVVRLRLSDDEYAKLQSDAGEACLTLSQYIRNKLF